MIPKNKKLKNWATYRATYTGLRVHAFGIESVLNTPLDLEIYQARVSPELWLVRPSSRHTAQWRARSAEDLMETVASFFEECIKPWEMTPHPAPERKPRPQRQTVQPESETVQ
jgi:hypothetical protein